MIINPDHVLTFTIIPYLFLSYLSGVLLVHFLDADLIQWSTPTL